MGVGEIIKHLRKQQGLSQGQLADRMGVSREYISAIERNKDRSISLRTATRLATALGVSPSVFFEETLMPPRPIEAILAELEIAQPVAIPIVGSIHLGIKEEPTEYAYWSRPKIANRNIKGLTARGFCLEPEIKEGDTIFVDIDRSPENGSIVLASMGEQVIARRYRENKDHVWLESNEERIDASECAIHGVVIEVSRRLE